MALINVVKCDQTDEAFAWKFPVEDLRLGSQLIVRPSQTALFVKGGVIADAFKPGTYTLKNGNLPILNKLINLPFGGDSPFQAEVWFINRITKLDNKWGTATPIQVEDPVYGIVVPMRAYGQYGLTVLNPKTFFESLVGTAKDFSASKIVEYFSGILTSSISSRLAKKIVIDRISVLQISVYLDDIAKDCANHIEGEFARYGVGIANFAIASISVPEDDPSVVKLKEAKELAMRVRTVGRDLYQMDRSLDIMQTAAGNEGGAGQVMGAGIGLGLGVGVGNAIANQMPTLGQPLQVSPPPLPTQTPVFFIAVSGVRQGPLSLEQITLLVSQGGVNRDTLVWRQGMTAWTKAGEVAELQGVFSSVPPSLPQGG
jgi:membrane protease subunit (stomatin/prohibitin family)